MSLSKNLIVRTLVIGVIGFGVIPHPAGYCEAFSDLEKGDFHYVAITYLKDNNIISGYDDGTFRAGQKINRAEALKMLILASTLPLTTETADQSNGELFTDTPADSWYYPYLKTAKDKEIISGYIDGSFKPDQTVNLAEALRMYLGCFDNIIYPNTADYTFADSSDTDWYAKYVAFAASRGLLNINSNNQIFPDQEMTRGYLAEIIYRMKMASEGYEFGKATYYGSALQGENTSSGEIFEMHDYTAAHKTLPFGTIVQVTNLANGESIEVKITDRGPYGPGRVLDLSSGAFKMISTLGTGIINAQYRIIFNPEDNSSDGPSI